MTYVNPKRVTWAIVDKANTSAPDGALAWIGLHGTAARVGAWAVLHFEDSDDFLLSGVAHRFGAYVVESRQRGVSGLDLLRLVRRRSDAAVLLLSAEPLQDFMPGLQSGADMVLGLDAPLEHVAAALAAVERRRGQAQSATGSWMLDRQQLRLLAPDGTEIALTDSDVVILQAVADAPDQRVPRELLLQRLWGADGAGMDNALHATVYRLRKRIEKNGRLLSPLQAVARVGYEFRARLQQA